MLIIPQGGGDQLGDRIGRLKSAAVEIKDQLFVIRGQGELSTQSRPTSTTATYRPPRLVLERY